MAEHYEDAAKRFQTDTATHEMTVLHDDGLYRHLRFRNPEHGFYWFDLITWPGSLAIRGDVDGYMFTRISDMFEFFRGKEINPHYWSEKADGGRNSCKSYSEALFTQQVADALHEAEETDPGVTAAWNAKVEGEYVADYYTTTEEDARAALDDFEYLPDGTTRTAASSAGHTITLPGHGLDDGQRIVFTDPVITGQLVAGRRYYVVSATYDTFMVANRWGGPALTVGTTSRLSWHGEPFRFEDTSEWDLQDYDAHFLWACHAIVWGIAQYDSERAAREGGRARRFLRDLVRALARQS